MNKHYIRLDEQSNITEGWSDGPCPWKDTTGAVCINEQGSYQFRLLPEGTENPSLRDLLGLYLYRYDNGKVIAKTTEELSAEQEALPPPPVVVSPAERIAALETALLELAGEIYG